MIRVIGAPADLCGRAYGSRLGPIALRLAGLSTALTECCEGYEDVGDLWAVNSDQPVFEDRLETGIEYIGQVKEAVARAVTDGKRPVVLGGDHSIAIGSVAGAMEARGAPIGLLWIDAHMDCNTPQASPSGNLHGMSVAALMRLPGDVSGPLQVAWDRALGFVPEVDVYPAWIGARSVDQGERENFAKMPRRFAATMKDIDRDGLAASVTNALAFFGECGVKDIWVSYDVDVLDPVFAPGTGTAVRGGFTYREGHLVVELLHEAFAADKFRLVGVDLMETNPLHDTGNETARIGVEVLTSLFGRMVLGPEYRQ